MFIGRRQDGSIYGLWTCKQWEGQEELPDDHPDVLAGPTKSVEQIAEESRRAAIRSDALRANLLNTLKTATAAQISNYVDNNVTDLPSARTMFKRILLAISLDQRDGG